MKKLCVWVLCLLLVFAGASAALAEPSPSPAAGTNELMQFKSTGERVVRVQLRLRELGYFNFKPTGNFQDMTVKSAVRFQQQQLDANGQPIIADGTIGAQSMDILFSPNATRTDIAASIPFGPSLSGSPTVTGALTDWQEVKSLLSEGQTCSFTDYNTGTTFNMKYLGGEQHAEMECATPADTASFLECFGGAFNYSKRPMVVQLGAQMIAASMQGAPHGEDSVPGNDMEGHVCV